MKFTVEQASDRTPNREVEINSMEELMKFISDLPIKNGWSKRIVISENSEIIVYDDYLE